MLARELKEDFFKTHCRGSQFIEVPACFNDGAGQVSAHEFVLGALHLECGAALLFFLERHSADARDLLEPVLNTGEIQRTVSPAHFDQHQLGPARAALQIVHRIRSHQLALVDDDDLFTGLLDFRQDVRTQNNRVVACQAFDQITGLIDLLGIESGGRLVQDKHVGIVNNSLSQADPLTVALG